MQKPINLALFNLMSLNCGLLVAALASRAASFEETLAQTILVQAQVVSEKTGEATLTAQLEITHVHCGPATLRGRPFTAESSATGEDSIGHRITPPLETGESGIWCLKERNGTLLPVRYLQHGIVWPAREKFSPRYAEAKALAEAIERVSKTTTAARPALLKSLVTSEASEVSAWAIHALASAGLSDGIAFLHQLSTHPRLSVPGQVALDETLAEADPAWNSSPERQRLLENWLSVPRGEFEAEAALNRLDVILQHRELKDATMLGLLKTATTNERLPLKVRRGAVRLIAMIAQRGQDGDAAFGQLLAQIQTAKEPELRLSAAHALKNFVALDAARADAVRAAKERSTDHQVADVLGQALERSRKPE